MKVFVKQYPVHTISKYMHALQIIMAHAKSEIPAFVLHSIADYCKINKQFHLYALEHGLLKKGTGHHYVWSGNGTPKEADAIAILNLIRLRQKKYCYEVSKGMKKKLSHQEINIDVRKSFMNLIREKSQPS